MFGQQDNPQQSQNGPWVTDVSPSSSTADDQQQGQPDQSAADTPLLEEQADEGQAANPPATATDASTAPADHNPPTDDHDSSLLDIKQQALQQLSPLIGHLEQSPEEKFRTLMMMIQAADNQSLISSAYEAANQISDEKVKAQALLDIVNEINYFTQH